jgi:hypothetical protein
VLCSSPERTPARIYASHPDHLAAGFLRQWATATAQAAGWEEGRLAEAFQAVDTA